MAELLRRRRQKSDDDSEKSFSESDLEVEDLNDNAISSKDTPEKAVPLKTADGSEYESAEEEEKILEKPVPCDPLTEPCAEPSEHLSGTSDNEETIPKEQESLSELVDEEGGEEGIAETEDVEEEFLNGDAPENGSEDEEFVEEERQQGDGEECSPASVAAEKELDFDEDRRNPQYIPKKGMFYEHDDRGNSEDVKEKPEEPTRDRKKKLWLDEGKWGHDRFREEEQFPKSRNELIDTYGYDIRNEDGPPRARRRRRYGRGPTKYDRNWEDVTAYGREKFKISPRGSPRGQRGVGRFSRGGNPRFRGRGQRALNFSGPRNDDEEEGLNTNTAENFVTNENGEAEVKDGDVPPVINREDFPALPTKNSEPEVEEPPLNSFSKSPPKIIEAQSVRTLTFENSSYSGRNSIERNSVERDVPPRRGKTPPFINNHNHERGNRRPNPRGHRGSGRGDYGGRGDYNRRGRANNNRHISPRFLENKANNNNLCNEMEQLSLEVHENHQICNEENINHVENNGELPSNPNMSEMALKGAGDSSGRPKRYSSLRQRSLPETSTYPTPPPQQVPPQHPPYYEAGYQTALYAPTESCVPTPSTQSQTATSAPLITPSAYQTFTPPPYSESYGLRMSVTPPPRLFPQVSVPAAQPILAPPPCITPAPTIMNFAPPPPPAGYPFTYPQFTTPPPQPAPAPPSEIFQPGITYYYQPTQPQPIRPTTVQQKRAKAIPIVPPPERETNRKEKIDPSLPNNSSHKYTDDANEADSVDITSVRTESSQLQSTVGVES